MAARVRRIDKAKERIGVVIDDVGKELRTTRISAGRSQKVIARAAKISQPQLARIELGKNERVPLSTLITVATMEGLKLVVSLYPDGDVIRDAAQTELLRRLRTRVGTGWQWRYEVLVQPGDQRAWDATSTHEATHAYFVVDAESRIRDAQEVLRRVTRKRDATGDVRVLLVVSDTHHNRAALAAARDLFAAEFPCPMRDALRALAEGRVPDADAVLVLAKERKPTQPDE
jgi:transcriptional regulator with XRE-family HTH domain